MPEYDNKGYGFNQKDADPLSTITNIRNKLSEIGILTRESFWYNNPGNIISCRVEIINLSLGANGKGISREFALASAYGELMERLQNQILFTKVKINPRINNEFGFYYDPYEKILSEENMLAFPDEFKNARLFEGDISLYDYYEDNKELLTKISPNRIYVPFYDFNKKDLQYLDFGVILKSYGSNGMCAGNSPAEAMCQGFCEIFERHAVKKIFYENVTPPTIPNEYLQQNANKQYELIKLVENTLKAKVIVKDCSLGSELPVIAIILFLENQNTYSVRFGSDPCWQIALERCITEMFQGKTSSHYSGATELNFINNSSYNHNDFNTVIARGEGAYPASFFSDSFSYSFNGMPKNEINSNEEKLKHIIGLLKKLKYNIFIRDTSFLGFNSYFIIVPGMSEVNCIINDDWIAKQSSFMNRINKLSKLSQLPEVELKQLADSMEKFVALPSFKKDNILFSEYVGLPTSENIPWNQMTLDFVLCAIYYRLGDYKNSYEKLNKFLIYAKAIGSKDVNLGYHQVALHFLGLLNDYPENFDKIKTILLNLFKKEVVEEVINDFSKKEEIFRYLPLPNNYNCKECIVQAFCNYQEFEIIYLNLKRKIKQNPINQIKMTDFFSN